MRNNELGERRFSSQRTGAEFPCPSSEDGVSAFAREVNIQRLTNIQPQPVKNLIEIPQLKI
tara:strand:- start:338 stop:520 length:183 start_codon:yes stop_codon:yes gene_type:complete